MSNTNTQPNTELPSIKTLIKSTVTAICVAGVILVTIVLPAEYGIDPTGVGKMIGLVKMGEIKVSLAQEAADDKLKDKTQSEISSAESQTATSPVVTEVQAKSDVSTSSDTMAIVLQPNEGKEIKLTMKKGEEVNYVWFTDGGRANFDVHADSKVLKINYHNYEKGSLENSEGVLTAAFDGNHGWFWRNRTSKTMKVTLQVQGDYSDIKLIN